jgi:hypothetical protein
MRRERYSLLEILFSLLDGVSSLLGQLSVSQSLRLRSDPVVDLGQSPGMLSLFRVSLLLKSKFFLPLLFRKLRISLALRTRDRRGFVTLPRLTVALRAL